MPNQTAPHKEPLGCHVGRLTIGMDFNSGDLSVFVIGEGDDVLAVQSIDQNNARAFEALVEAIDTLTRQRDHYKNACDEVWRVLEKHR